MSEYISGQELPGFDGGGVECVSYHEICGTVRIPSMFGQLDFQYFWFDAIQDKLKMVGGKRQVLQEAFQDTCLNTTELSVYP